MLNFYSSIGETVLKKAIFVRAKEVASHSGYPARDGMDLDLPDPENRLPS